MIKQLLLYLVLALVTVSAIYATNPVIITAPTTTLTVPVPLYGATYSPTSGTDAEVMLQILAELKAIRSELQALKAGNPATAKAVPFDTLKRNCGACHNSKTAGDKGGELVLIDEQGKLGLLSRADRREILSRVSKGTMPPTGKLSEADKEAILSMFN